MNETATHYFLHCSKLDTKRAKVMKNMSHVLRRNSLCPFNVSTEELLGEHNFSTEDSKTVRGELKKYFNSTIKKFEAKESNSFASQLYSDISFFYLCFFIYVIITHL